MIIIEDALLLINKPIGKTSHDVVFQLKKLTGAQKVGHAGTLDPLASGLLILLFNGATRLSEKCMLLDKSYEGVAELGKTSITYDAEGPVTESGDPSQITPSLLEQAMKGFLGAQQQLAPMFSAKKVQGKSLYKLARKGIEVERLPHDITLYRWDLLSYEMPYMQFKLNCSKGTYVRTLVHDLGQKLKCGGYLKSLCRTQIGPFSLEKACAWEIIERRDLEALRPYLISSI